MEFSNRQKQILAAIVREYINTGQPVGSKRVKELLNIDVSSATIRNEMATLYDEGYLEQPHTSAGRVPSHIGIRTYIDDLMTVKPLTKKERGQIESLFNVRNPDPDKILGEAADALSDFTGYATVTSSLIDEKVLIQRLEFIGAGPTTVVIVLIASNGVVRSKVCRVDFLVTQDILDFFDKFANNRFTGRSIDSITSSYVSAVGLSLGDYSRLFTGLILAIFELCQEISKGKYYVSGSTKLLSYSDELGRLAHDLLVMIDSPENLHKLFGSHFAGPTIMIGKENAAVELTDSSVIVTQYYVDKEPAGTVGIIGPMRLDYSRIIPHLKYFAETLGNLLDDTLDPEKFQDN